MDGAGLSAWQEIVLLVGPGASAIAALGSWAAVMQARRLGREARAPRLHIQLLVDRETRRVSAVVTNMGDGGAAGVVVYLGQPPYYTNAVLGHGALFPGEARHIQTEFPWTDAPLRALAFGRDRDGFAHYWNEEERHEVYKTPFLRRPRYRPDIFNVWLEFHPDVNLDDLVQHPCTVTEA